MGEYRVEHSALLGGIGIQLTAHAFHAVENVPRAAVFRSLENGVFNKVGQAILAASLVTTAGIDSQSAPRDPISRHQMHQSQTIGKYMVEDIHSVFSDKATAVRGRLLSVTWNLQP